jgi:hypothetical protein
VLCLGATGGPWVCKQRRPAARGCFAVACQVDELEVLLDHLHEAAQANVGDGEGPRPSSNRQVSSHHLVAEADGQAHAGAHPAIELRRWPPDAGQGAQARRCRRRCWHAREPWMLRLQSSERRKWPRMCRSSRRWKCGRLRTPLPNASTKPRCAGGGGEGQHLPAID